MLKAAIKHASNVDKVRHRTLPPEKIAQWAAKLGKLNDEVAAILKEEKEEKAIHQAEMELPHLYRQRDMATRLCVDSGWVYCPRLAAAAAAMPTPYRYHLHN